ncbi:glycosyltransferase family 2 protein [Arenibacter algicola]|uniref:glycosyltransferase family A protein n=1 Tax=Arenibacter algicola TaxID=616991 RepID=UPI001C071386|nr:glycosyltransferase family A protein [Arenibacter algicola]MBU2904285.1 glycosyltransferase family 2 protein [Arenibacter algicola]
MITFIIPVKSKKVTGSWEQFSKLFERTLKSICNQTSQNFRVLVVCHEKPEIQFERPNIEYIHVDFEPPQLKTAPKEKHDGLKEEDKSKKILAGIAYAEKYNSDYLMVADADDCISNKIVEFVDKNKKANNYGWFFKKGYIYREGDKFISLNKENFNTLCGTCIIIKPQLIEHIFKKVPHLLYVHKTTDFPNDVHLQEFPFPGAVYSMANGENHYMSNDQIKNLNSGSIFSLSTIKGIFRKIRKYRVKPLSNKLKKEFGLYNLTN